ncbi:MAG TPA: AtpZ/AtpI family protein [Methylomusa anaerophila]|uniref:F0F1-ATPase subunit n=1 Tax=Methylomusa anaerophila TaxID=1930071 RepID=A0A348ALB5_9FIRM|nr:AtpZ/AtpI family protein [Methylomusa anaerophila]BBB91863.1 Putative F0F1-ATPase subunit [Methylomusa anaerophila]HML88406.1 AtpZ/AtpI family protein [Methylomusa anaerophila]
MVQNKRQKITAKITTEEYDTALKDAVENKAARKLRKRLRKFKNIWFGFSVFGLVGWSVVVPCLLGTLLGIWLDRNYPRQYSWTLTFLLAGLILGCFNAWRWVEKERQKIHREEDDG